ncbi:MAG: sigma-70 family RNA polymerase sigma factor [Clostridiales bacterium]|nr:sigma-70 family RNA polymerase sigma factor [Clostridiales bacterium]
MTREQERELVQKAQEGDSESFEKLVIDNQTKVYNLALRMVGNEDDAFDMAQESFLRAYNSLSSFRGDSRFSVWLYRLTTNICLDFLRSESRRSHSSLTYMGEGEDDKELEIPDERFSPELIAEKNELRQEVRGALMSLPEDYRVILLLREINGLSYEEIGSCLSLEAGTVKSRIFRARKKLCSILSDEGNLSGSSSSNKAKGV